MGHIDTRAFHENKLVPPAPLPHLSRKAIKRVKDPLPAPTDCRYCGVEVELVSNAEIYGREYGEWPYAYLCRGCGAYVGVHRHTDIPLGILADRALRTARQTHKGHFLYLQKRAGWSRKQAYAFLAGELGVPVSSCHWGWFEIEDCEQAGAICRRKLEELHHGRH